ncbi:MAG: Gfo/Idh/MocA family oxidoreductase [Armatimonadota bacterium]|nr:Gfo/Idh/MocA family oxidoreductase [Armatimonadota bacterium]MDR7528327.1 Gfo/Idh/MocA family oxidoreductase [Armatimonadota bacterium]MDR7543720.1 Gfo/Idh/MocA family oxidoreductase [Armatimonadota bacterium]MDR7573766.1 Gfo/Idh/MocA family oxidoreductase [Armatimonadota bacterium]MDR7584688.1 Gfo/Idh/MocA family oxidoreductase [Armatimonadota bacterium]
MTIRHGVIGAGQAGAQHARAVARSPQATLAWIADPVVEHGAPLAAELGTTHYTDYRAGLGQVETVSICVPHAALSRTALEAIAAGCHVLLEKPMATSLTDADAVIAAASTAGVVLMVGFVHRYRQEVRRAFQLLRDGAVGTPVFLADYGVGGGQERWPAWVQRAEAGGGLLLYTEVHRIDRARWLLGEEVTAVWGSLGAFLPGSDVESSVAALLHFPRGVRASLVYHYHQIALPFRWETEVHGTDGMLRIITGRGLEIATAGRTWWEDAPAEGHFDAELAAFLNAVAGEPGDLPTGLDGREALRIARAIADSHAKRRLVRLRDGGTTD